MLDTSVTIGYDTPWRRCRPAAAGSTRHHRYHGRPAPYVIQTALSDWYIEYRLVAYAGPETLTKRARGAERSARPDH